MLAKITWGLRSVKSSSVLVLKAISFMLFFAAFSMAFSTNQLSISTPVTFSAPCIFAAMAKTPVPVPISKTVLVATLMWRSCSSISCVVAWWPVPKDICGSIIISCLVVAALWNEALMVKSPTVMGWNCSSQRALQFCPPKSSVLSLADTPSKGTARQAASEIWAASSKEI